MPAAGEGAARSPGPGPPAPSTCWSCWWAGSDRPSGEAGGPLGHFSTTIPVQGMARTTHRVTACPPPGLPAPGVQASHSPTPPTQTYKDPALTGAD